MRRGLKLRDWSHVFIRTIKLRSERSWCRNQDRTTTARTPLHTGELTPVTSRTTDPTVGQGLSGTLSADSPCNSGSVGSVWTKACVAPSFRAEGQPSAFLSSYLQYSNYMDVFNVLLQNCSSLPSLYLVGNSVLLSAGFLNMPPSCHSQNAPLLHWCFLTDYRPT